MILPPQAVPLLTALAPAFPQPTYRRFLTRLRAPVRITGRRTVAHRLRTRGGLAPGQRTASQQVFSPALGSMLERGWARTTLLLAHLIPDGTVVLVGDDTVAGHPGKKGSGTARHRHPVRSSHSHTAWRYGPNWVVLALLVRFPCAARPWALPVLVDLDRSPEDHRRRQRPHPTSAPLICRLARLMLRRFPSRHFLFAGDTGSGTYEVGRFCPATAPGSPW